MDVTFLLLEGYSNFVLACLLEPLRMLRERYGEGITWQIVTVDDRQVSSSSGLTLTPTQRLDRIEHHGMLVIISSNGFREHATAEKLRLVRSHVRRSETVIGADAGAWLLAAMGVLDNCSATVHWSIADEFAETFPQVRLSDAPYVIGGRFWSCGGASSGLDLVRAFIKMHYGDARAFAVTSMFTQDTGTENDRSPGSVILAGTGETRLDPILKIMISTMEAPLSLEVLSRRAGLSPRGLNRLFKSELGVAPRQYYQSLRLSRARELAATTSLDLREIALRCGYSGAAALCKAFRLAYGHPIRKSPKSSITTF